MHCDTDCFIKSIVEEDSFQSEDTVFPSFDVIFLTFLDQMVLLCSLIVNVNNILDQIQVYTRVHYSII